MKPHLGQLHRDAAHFPHQFDVFETINYVGAVKRSLPGPLMAKISARFFLSLYICHKHPCEIASHSIKQFVLYSCLKQECCLYPIKWIKLSIVRL